MKEVGINPALIKQFLNEHLEIAEQINNDLEKDLPEITFYKNKVAFQHVRMLIALIEMNE